MEFIYKPKVKAVINILYGIVTTILSGALINQLTINNKIVWVNALHKFETLGLIGISLIFIIYTIITTKEEESIRKDFLKSLSNEMKTQGTYKAMALRINKKIEQEQHYCHSIPLKGIAQMSDNFIIGARPISYKSTGTGLIQLDY